VSAPAPARGRVNLRTPDIMAGVQAQVESHYRRAAGGVIVAGATTIRLAKEFGFCYGVERAIDLAYAARKVFPDRPISLLGEIIHNPDVNAQMEALQLAGLGPEDIVIVPAFGAEVATVQAVRDAGCEVVDTTCGDVMSVWKRVRQNAGAGVTSIIHGKASHEETRATASRALASDGTGHYLVVLDTAQTDTLCHFIRHGGDPAAFLETFRGAHSPGFDPLRHLERVGVANQTTMLRSETEEIQRRIRSAIADRDGGDTANFRHFDTICGATQERQDALHTLLKESPDMLVVIGGYNSSNTSHLVEIGQTRIPTWFVRNARCLESHGRIRHFDLERSISSAGRKSQPPGGCRIPASPSRSG